MKTLRVVAWLGFLFLGGFTGLGQNFVGTNSPGTGTNYTFTVGSGATNLSLVISNNATVYSYLLVSKGGTPTDTSFNFASRLTGQTNQINLEAPEFVTGTYGLRVSTPAASATQPFSVIFTTNRTNLRSAGYPVSKPLVFSDHGQPGEYGFRCVELFSGGYAVQFADRLADRLSSTNTTTPGLYIRRNQLPTTGSYDKAVAPGQPIDTIIFTSAEATNSTYFIGVYQPLGAASSANYVLSTELASITTLTWDPGTTDAGTQVFTNQSLTGGDYYFAITSQNTADQVWRTALNVKTNEADVYMSLQGNPCRSHEFVFIRIKARGFGWFCAGAGAAIHARPELVYFGPRHSGFSVEPGVTGGSVCAATLPALAADASSSGSDGNDGGGRSMHFFKTTISPNTLAWRLWLNGLGNQIYVKQSAAPVPYNTSYV